MEYENRYASKGVGGTALGIGIGALGLELLRNGAGGLLNVNGCNKQNCNHNDDSSAIAAASLLTGLVSNMRSTCNEDHYVNRYEATQNARIAELETEVKLRDSNIYTDGKILELYKYVDGKFTAVDAALAQQAVYNATNTATINCISGQVAQLMALTKLVIPNGSICPGWGTVTVAPATTTTT